MRTRTIKKSVKRKRPPSVRATGAKRKTNPITTYWKGDLAEYTGKSKVFYGGLFYELVLLEGANKGKKVWTDQPPKKKNPQYKVEAKVPSNIRPITHEVKVPTRTLAVLATRGYVQEMGGGNPNAYTYKSTKLGTAKWRVEAVPKVKSSSGTVKALTAGSAVRKFKKTLAGRGRFKTPRGAYEISVAKNPKRKRRNPPATGFLAAGKIYRKLEELKRQPLTMRRTAAIYKLEQALEKAYAAAYAAERAKDASLYEAPRTFSTAKRKGGGVRKKKNPRAARSYEASMAKVQAALDRLYLKPSPTAADKQKIKKLERYQTSIFNKSWADEEGQFKEGLKKESLRAQKVDARREKAAAKRKANPRRRKPAVKANPYVEYEPLDRKGRLALAKKVSGAKDLIRYIKEGWTDGELRVYFASLFGLDTTDIIAVIKYWRKKLGISGASQNPRKRKSTAKTARKNSVKSTIKKVVKSVKKVFKKKNDGSSDREEFAGKVSGYKELFFPPGTPHGLSTLGPLVHIETDKANIRPAKGMAMLCQDSNHNLYVGSTSPDAAAYTGSESLRNKNLGKVMRIEYRCSKPHLGAEYKGNITWYHDFEAPLPTLKTDSDGRFIFSGGGYTVKREGITG